jgi:hypothetical protein
MIMAGTYPIFTPEELANEEWREVVGYEGIYSISNLGRVRRDLTNGNTKAGRILKPQTDKKGYFMVSLYKNNKPRSTKIHHMVVYAFIGPRPEGMQINHKDPKTGKANNRLDNLEYCTGLENIRHAHAHGLMRFATGENSGARKHPERVARGDRSGARLHPERLSRGENHYSKTHPEKVLRGEKCGTAKLKDAEIPRLFELRAQGLLLREISAIVGIGTAQVSNILNGNQRKTW